MVQAFGAERTLLKVIDKSDKTGMDDLQHLDWQIEMIVEDAERQAKREW